MEATLDVVRLIHYAASIAVFGGSLFRLVAGDGLGDGTLRRIVVTASVVAGLSAGLWLVVAAGNMAGGWSYCLNRGTLTTVLDDTLFGQVWRWRLALAVVLPLVCRWGGWWMTTMLGAAFLASLADEGHSAWLGGTAGALHLANQAVHLVAAGAWLGGLVPLGLWLGDRAVSDVSASRCVGLFSRLGYCAVVLVLATGAVNTAILGQDGQLLSTAPWSLVLAAKLILVVAMLVLALVNRLGLARDHGRAGLYRRIGIELTLGILILAAASVLGTLPPPQA